MNSSQLQADINTHAILCIKGHAKNNREAMKDSD